MVEASRGTVPQTIDLGFLGQPGVIAAFLLQSPDGSALIEVGPASTVATLLAALAAAGVDPRSVRHLLVTHIHLDHAGAAGMLLQSMPEANVYVHAAGAAHLADPTKLLNSAGKIYGSLMKRLWGEVLPVPEKHIVPLVDNQVLELADRRLQVLSTPGHAIHHVVYRDLDDGSIYAGDVAGIRMQGSEYVRPPTPPPDLDVEAWEASIDRLVALNPTVFYLTHFGRSTGTLTQLRQLRAKLRAWEHLVYQEMLAGHDHTAITLALQRAGDAESAAQQTPELVRQYETASSSSMNVSGYERYLRKRHPELAVPASGL